MALAVRISMAVGTTCAKSVGRVAGARRSPPLPGIQARGADVPADVHRYDPAGAGDSL